MNAIFALGPGDEVTEVRQACYVIEEQLQSLLEQTANDSDR